jgi:hypothetical protein
MEAFGDARDCPTKTIREEALEQGLFQQLRRIEFSQAEKDHFRSQDFDNGA